MDAYFPSSDFDESQFDGSSPEVRELGRIVWELDKIYASRPKIDRQEPRRWLGDVLQGIIASSEKSKALIEMLEGAEYFVGGDEHHIIRVDSEPDRIYKFTHGDNFGCRSYFSPHNVDLLGHFHGETNDDPVFYLFRWMILNAIGDFQTRFEGFVPPERPGWLPRICISQPALPVVNPTVPEIRKSLAQFGFVEVCENAYFDPATGLLLTDAAPRNVRVSNGIPIPFDAIAQIPEGRLLEWCLKRSQRP